MLLATNVFTDLTILASYLIKMYKKVMQIISSRQKNNRFIHTNTPYSIKELSLCQLDADVSLFGAM